MLRQAPPGKICAFWADFDGCAAWCPRLFKEKQLLELLVQSDAEDEHEFRGGTELT